MDQVRPKAVQDGYTPAPFFYRQENDAGHARTIAWTDSVSAQRTTLMGLLELLPERLEVLLKVKREAEEPENGEVDDTWRRYYGRVDRGELLEAIEQCESFVFCDSRNQLCVRDPVTLDYLVLDHVGVIYIYSDNRYFREVLVRNGFEERIEPLINEKGYWSQEPKESASAGAEFRRLLHLESVPGPQESQSSPEAQ